MQYALLIYERPGSYDGLSAEERESLTGEYMAIRSDPRRPVETSGPGVQSGYSSLRQTRGSSEPAFGVRWSSNELYGATNGSGAITV
jgi:hypothetical protein